MPTHAADRVADRVAELAVRVLTRAARDGHTALPEPTVCAAIAGGGVDDPTAALTAAAVADDRLLGCAAGAGPRHLALASLGATEAALAHGVERLLRSAQPWPAPGGADTGAVPGWADGLAVALVGSPAAEARVITATVELARRAGRAATLIAAGPGAARRLAGRLGHPVRTLTQLLDGPDEGPHRCDLVIVAAAERLDVETARRLVAVCPDRTHLLLVGDPALLPPPGPGQVLGDLVASGAVAVTEPTAPVAAAPVTEPTAPVAAAPEAGAGTPGAAASEAGAGTPGADGGGRALAGLAAAVRAGRLPPVHSPDREVVVVPAPDAATATRRVVQLVADSIPRALGMALGDVQVLTPRRTGAAGVAALETALTAALPGAKRPPVRTVTAAGDDTWPAVVAVLPAEAAGALSRPLVYTAITRAERHLSIVHAAGPELARAVRDVAARPRHTRLAGLLASTGTARSGPLGAGSGDTPAGPSSS